MAQSILVKKPDGTFEFMQMLFCDDGAPIVSDLPEYYLDKGALFIFSGTTPDAIAEDGGTVQYELSTQVMECSAETIKLFNYMVSTLSDDWSVAVYEVPARNIVTAFPDGEGEGEGEDYTTITPLRPNRRVQRLCPLGMYRLEATKATIYGTENIGELVITSTPHTASGNVTLTLNPAGAAADAFVVALVQNETIAQVTAKIAAAVDADDDWNAKVVTDVNGTQKILLTHVDYDTFTIALVDTDTTGITSTNARGLTTVCEQVFSKRVIDEAGSSHPSHADSGALVGGSTLLQLDTNDFNYVIVVTNHDTEAVSKNFYLSITAGVSDYLVV